MNFVTFASATRLALGVHSSSPSRNEFVTRAPLPELFVIELYLAGMRIAAFVERATGYSRSLRASSVRNVHRGGDMSDQRTTPVNIPVTVRSGLIVRRVHGVAASSARPLPFARNLFIWRAIQNRLCSGVPILFSVRPIRLRRHHVRHGVREPLVHRAMRLLSRAHALEPI